MCRVLEGGGERYFLSVIVASINGTFILNYPPHFFATIIPNIMQRFITFVGMKPIYKSENIEVLIAQTSDLELPHVGSIAAGFPSPADDYDFERIDLNKILIKNPEATFYARVKGRSMKSDFEEGDLLVIDRSLEWSNNRIALCFINGEFTLKRIKMEGGKCYLVPSNSDFPIIEATDDNEVMLWGVVTYSIKKH